MREIKFRTWDTQNKEFSEWTNRDPFFSTSHGQIFFWERTQKEDGTYDGDIILEDLGNRFILEQYTGLKDKNGKEIYEGDIVKLLFDNKKAKEVLGEFLHEQFLQRKDTWIGAVKGDFDEGILSHFQYCVDFIPFFKFKSLIESDGIEVIGNIHKNPELLN